jgi:hypothetical protein
MRIAETQITFKESLLDLREKSRKGEGERRSQEKLHTVLSNSKTLALRSQTALPSAPPAFKALRFLALSRFSHEGLAFRVSISSELPEKTKFLTLFRMSGREETERLFLSSPSNIERMKALDFAVYRSSPVELLPELECCIVEFWTLVSCPVRGYSIFQTFQRRFQTLFVDPIQTHAAANSAILEHFSNASYKRKVFLVSQYICILGNLYRNELNKLHTQLSSLSFSEKIQTGYLCSQALIKIPGLIRNLTQQHIGKFAADHERVFIGNPQELKELCPRLSLFEQRAYQLFFMRPLLDPWTDGLAPAQLSMDHLVVRIQAAIDCNALIFKSIK